MVIKYKMKGLSWYTTSPIPHVVCDWCFEHNKELCEVPVWQTLTQVDVGKCKVCSKFFTSATKEEVNK